MEYAVDELSGEANGNCTRGPTVELMIPPLTIRESLVWPILTFLFLQTLQCSGTAAGRVATENASHVVAVGA